MSRGPGLALLSIFDELGGCRFTLACALRHGSSAATALVHGMTVVTRNLADFVPKGVLLLKPWQASPSA